MRTPLVGGRVEVVSGQPVPTLVYRRGSHMITVVTKPVASGLTAALMPAPTKVTMSYAGRAVASVIGSSQTSTPGNSVTLWMPCVRGQTLFDCLIEAAAWLLRALSRRSMA